MLEPELPMFVARLALADLDQFLKHRSIQLPGPVLIGIGQRRAGRCPLHSQMPQFPFACRQTADDLPQGSGAAQVAEHERDELHPARHALGMLFALMLFNCGIEDRAWKEFQNLTENAGYSFHGWVTPFRLVVSQLQLYSGSPALLVQPSAHGTIHRCPVGPSTFWTGV